MKALLQSLPERKRRTFLRYMEKKNRENVEVKPTDEEQKDDLMSKLNALKVDEDDEDDDFDDFSDCDEEVEDLSGED